MIPVGFKKLFHPQTQLSVDAGLALVVVNRSCSPAILSWTPFAVSSSVLLKSSPAHCNSETPPPSFPLSFSSFFPSHTLTPLFSVPHHLRGAPLLSLRINCTLTSALGNLYYKFDERNYTAGFLSTTTGVAHFYILSKHLKNSPTNQRDHTRGVSRPPLN